MTDLLSRPRRIRDRASSVSSRVRAHPARAPVGIGLLALAISLIGIGVPSVWYDEAATITAATRSWPQLWQLLGTVDAVHGAYYVLMHLVIDLVGYSPVTLRLPAAIFTAVAAALTVVLARMVLSERLALVAGLVFCLLPRVTWMGGEGRSYALSAALAVLLTILLVHAQRAPTATSSRRRFVLYAAVAALGCVVYIYLALVVVAHGVTMAWWRVRTGRSAAPVVRRFLGASVAAAVAVLPLVAEVVDQSGQLEWIDPLGPETPVQVLRDQWFIHNSAFAVAGCLLLVVGAVALGRRAGGFSAAAVLLPALVLPTAALLIATEVYTPLFSPRYLTMTVPIVAIVIAAGIAAIPGRATAVIAVVVLLGLSLPTILDQRAPDAKQLTTWNRVADLIADERAQDPGAETAIIYGPVRYHATATTRVIAYAYPEAFAGTTDVTIRTPAAETGELWETRGKLAESLDRLDGAETAFLITSIKRDRRGATTELLSDLGWTLTNEWNLTDVNVLRYERR